MGAKEAEDQRSASAHVVGDRESVVGRVHELSVNSLRLILSRENCVFNPTRFGN